MSETVDLTFPGEYHVCPSYGREHDTEQVSLIDDEGHLAGIGDSKCWCSPTVEEVRDDDGDLLGCVVMHREDN